MRYEHNRWYKPRIKPRISFNSKMQKPAFYLMSCIIILCLLAGCASAPVTGRSQLLLLSEQQEVGLGLQAYEQVLSQEKISQDAQINAMVKRVGTNIAAAANKPGYNWEFTVIDADDTANAFALPGGKVAVYTGLLPYTKDEDGLAFVLGHEVGHAIARHGGESRIGSGCRQDGGRMTFRCFISGTYVF